MFIQSVVAIYVILIGIVTIYNLINKNQGYGNASGKFIFGSILILITILILYFVVINI